MVVILALAILSAIVGTIALCLCIAAKRADNTFSGGTACVASSCDDAGVNKTESADFNLRQGVRTDSHSLAGSVNLQVRSNEPDLSLKRLATATSFESGDGANIGIGASGRVSGTRTQPSDMSANHGHEHSRQSDSRLRPDSKFQLVSDDGDGANFLGWLVFHAFALWASVSHWLRFKRICAWCEPQRRIGGNPFASKVTHGICEKCFAKQAKEILKHPKF